ncbi:hypothetical protein LAV84_23005 [Rhizobium sp. VS19-DR104.2]|uniref:hypothetical protein n=1 Tax=unclassified Rhizobium TaxID=2613769 RepID=UPI001C5B1687|nr:MULTISPECIES: hypothetical protein [unclassified Rhizobium]MBZ5762098.1 hypothetical protein [Rhizobium sp. VS19-DR96]MBZ5768211.1 hypothetical protein [Rhizobium sp. VS19-DR129.2]MBZ5775724.1 hypothetical protein [Rhizobium sp. VS19-DRK62.2]MBZ5786975.1 hypothetical protein [Rhizobium sp. VS19-DR121]MBZ5804136.1 hypothetical protein [Rhizobium sp. VS19-DR181]
MSFDVYVQRFHAGSQSTFSRRHFDRIFAERLVARDTVHRCITLGYPDGGGGDVYIDHCEEIGGFTVNRPGGTQLFDDLFQLMRDVGAVLYWADASPCLVVADPMIVTDLPSSMLTAIGPATTVFSGSEIIAAIRKS